MLSKWTSKQGENLHENCAGIDKKDDALKKLCTEVWKK